jgi:hypothetical protein
LCLEDGTYAFNIADSGNNGLCCLNGNGNYVVSVGTDVVKNNSQYDSHDSFTFTVKNGKLYFPTFSPTTQPSFMPSMFPSHAPSRVPSAAPNASPVNSPSANPSAKPSVVPSTGPSVAPSLNPSAAPTPWDFSCADDEQLLNIDIEHDNRPEETSWVLYSYENHALALLDHGNSSLNLCVKFGKFMWVITDKGNDGMCTYHGKGGYSIALDSKVVASGCDFGDLDVVWFDSVNHSYPVVSVPKCSRYEEFVHVSIDRDVIPFQVSWKINEIGSNVPLYSGNYSESRIVCLLPGYYVFTIGDQGCDGMESDGGFQLTHEGLVLLNGSTFDCSYSGVFNVTNKLHYPSANPSFSPSVNPSAKPSAKPSAVPSANPSANPSAEPSSSPTIFDFYPTSIVCGYDEWAMQLLLYSTVSNVNFSVNAVHSGTAQEMVKNGTLEKKPYPSFVEFCLSGGSYLLQLFGDNACYRLGRARELVTGDCFVEHDAEIITVPDRTASTDSPTAFNDYHCGHNMYFVDVQMRSGSNPAENSWYIKAQGNSTAVLSKDSAQNGSVCVRPGYYVFAITDTGDNGMGPGGRFEVFVGRSRIVSHHNFTSVFSQVFYVGATESPVSSPSAAPSAAPSFIDPISGGESTSCSACRDKCRQFMATALSCSSNTSVTLQTFDYDTMVDTASNWVNVASALSTTSYHECLQLPGPASQCLLYYNNAASQCKSLGIESCDWVVGFDSKASPSYSWPFCLPSLCADDYSWFIQSDAHTVEVLENCTSVSGAGARDENSGAFASISGLVFVLLGLLVLVL